MELSSSVEVKIDQDRWVVQIKEDIGMNGEEREEKEMYISIFAVPKELVAAKEEAYVPQCVSIGPYHHWRSELSEMERYKVAAARRFQKRIPVDCAFESHVVGEMKKHERQIRACYHKYLDYTEEALAWLMALDASFLLECLQFYVKQADQASSHVSSDVKQLGRVLDPSGRSATHNAIMRDLSMLENQIPLFLLQKLLEMQLASQDKAEERLSNLVSLACDELSPFMFKMRESSKLRIKERAHILEVLYYSIVPAAALDASSVRENGDEKEALPDTSYITGALKRGWEAVASLNIGPVRRLTALPRRLFKLKIIKFFMRLPVRLLSVLGNLPILRSFKQPLNILFGSAVTEKDEKTESSSVETPPTRDELTVPSVSELCSAGVKLRPTDGDVTTIRFDQATATLYLPKVKLDANSEVVLRNLVAFEASAAPGAMVFTRYTDFMNAMIDKDEDVRLLVNSKIICNHLANEGKVANLWNSMGDCVKLGKVDHLDKVIADINKHYNRTWSVAVIEYMNKYIFGSWQCLTFLATAILLILACLQAFCSVYDCKSWSTDTKILQG